MSNSTSLANTASAIQKVELPLDTDLQMIELVEQFESCCLPIVHWTHRAHLAVGIVYVSRFSFDEALSRIRIQINQYNRNSGNPLGYNETVTILFLRKIASVLSHDGTNIELHKHLSELAGICNVAWIYDHYSRELIWSTEAKASWKEPDVKPLDF